MPRFAYRGARVGFALPYARKARYARTSYKRAFGTKYARGTAKAPNRRMVDRLPKRYKPKSNARTGGYTGIELKFKDYARSLVAIATSVAGSEVDPATEKCLSGVAQGDGENQRNGRKYRMRSILIKGFVDMTNLTDETTAPLSTIVRVLLVLDKQTNGAQFNAEDVLLDTVSEDVLSMRHMEHVSRFEVLYDKIIHLKWYSSSRDGIQSTDPMTSTYTGDSQHFEIYKKLDIGVLMKGTSANVTDVTDNSLHLMAIGFADGSAAVRINYQSRLRFTE